jgi:hypothetical protein
MGRQSTELREVVLISVKTNAVLNADVGRDDFNARLEICPRNLTVGVRGSKSDVTHGGRGVFLGGDKHHRVAGRARRGLKIEIPARTLTPIS